MILWILSFSSTFFKTGVPQIKEFWLISSGKDPVGQFQLRVLGDATELEFSGSIGFGAAESVNSYLDAHPAIKLIHLNSKGGRVEAARKLAELIMERGLSTYTSQDCLSACIIPYAAGKKRYIDKNANLGFHQYDFPGSDQADFYAQYDLDKKYLLSKGITQNFIDRIFDTPASGMWKPSHDELFESNFITDYPSFEEVAITSVSLSELDKFEEVFSDVPIYDAIKKANPEGYNQIVIAYKQAIERGKSLADVRKLTLPIVFETLNQRLSYASGEAIIGFTQLVIDQYKYYEIANPEKCYDYISGSSFSVDTSDLPQSLIDRELNVTANAINTYSRFNEPPYEEEVSPYLEYVFNKLGVLYGDDALLIFESTHSSFQEKLKYCTITISLFEQILSLPPADAVKTLRYMYEQKVE